VGWSDRYRIANLEECVMKKKNYGLAFLPLLMAPGVLLTLAFGIPVLLFGLGSVFAFVKMMFFSPVSGGIPVWSILVIGVLVLLYVRRKRAYAPTYR